jgi:putative ABC transport system substrate-binding protein
LGELVPAARTIALLVNPNNSNTEQRLEEMREAARVVDRELLVVTASGEHDFELAFATIRQRAGREVVPGLRRLAVMVNVSNLASVLEMGDVQAAARTFGFEVATSEIRRVEDIATALDRLKGRADALYVCADPFVNANRVRINTLALGVRLPTMHSYREYVEAGGLISYGPNIPNLFRRAAEFVEKILHGTKPADIPVEQPTKFDLVINLITAKALGLEIPSSVLARADAVIE